MACSTSVVNSISSGLASIYFVRIHFTHIYIYMCIMYVYILSIYFHGCCFCAARLHGPLLPCMTNASVMQDKHAVTMT